MTTSLLKLEQEQEQNQQQQQQRKLQTYLGKQL